MKQSIKATLTLCGILALSPITCKNETRKPEIKETKQTVDFWNERKNKQYSPRSNPNDGWSSLTAPQPKQEHSTMCFYDEPKYCKEEQQEDVSP